MFRKSASGWSAACPLNGPQPHSRQTVNPRGSATSDSGRGQHNSNSRRLWIKHPHSSAANLRSSTTSAGTGSLLGQFLHVQLVHLARHGEDDALAAIRHPVGSPLQVEGDPRRRDERAATGIDRRVANAAQTLNLAAQPPRTRCRPLHWHSRAGLMMYLAALHCHSANFLDALVAPQTPLPFRVVEWFTQQQSDEALRVQLT